MNERFWDLFSDRYTENCLRWDRAQHNPVLAVHGDTWQSRWTGGPFLLNADAGNLLYYHGNGIMPGTDREYHDRIGAAEIARIGPDLLDLRELNNGLPVIDTGTPGEFDTQHIRDPWVLGFEDRTVLFYSGLGAGNSTIGCAVSSDGIRFRRQGPVLEGRSPTAALRNNRIAFMYQVTRDGIDSFKAAESFDGTRVVDIRDEPVFRPSGSGWDSRSVSGCRLWSSGPYFYLMYAGSPEIGHEAGFFGLARSADLITWERHPGNPVFGCGPRGAEDGGSISSPCLVETDTHFIMLYEGSRGTYGWDVSSQVCMASIRNI